MKSPPCCRFSVSPMMSFKRSPRSIKYILSLLTTATVVLPAGAQMLKGTATKEDRLNPGGTGMTLDRRDIQKMGDPFGGSGNPPPSSGDQAFDPGNFQVSSMAPPPPPQMPLQGNAQGNGSPFNGQYGQAMPAQEAPPQQPMHNLNAQTGGPPPQMNVNDPDSSPEMQIAWNEWHRRVAEAVYIRYTGMANKVFYRSAPMMAAAAYVVSRDGKIVNAHLTQKNGNPIYNAIVLTAINSLNGDMSVLAFPQGSRRMSVDKSATFTQNWGPVQGFKYQMGDQETIRQQRR